MRDQAHTVNRPEKVFEPSETPPAFTPYRSVPSPSALLAAAWFPSATSSSAETYCFLRSVRDAPLHLIDGVTGQVRASYPIIDHTERFIGPHSLAFSSDGTRLFAGHENAIELIDIASPGQPGTRMSTTPNRRSKDGQKGLISALATNPHDPSQLAAGSYSSTVALYDLDTERMTHMWQIHGGGGVTQVAYHPTSAETLIVGSRCSSSILCYDLRNTSMPYRTLDRGRAKTNQRMGFSLDLAGRYLAAGDQDGRVRIFGFADDSEDPLIDFRPHHDAIGSAALHPYMPILLTCSGSRRFDTAATDSSDESSASEAEVAEAASRAGVMALWDLGCTPSDAVPA